MPIPEWFAGYLIGIIALQLLFFWYLIRRSDRSTDDDGGPAGKHVECPECSETNKSSYQFCRSCVEELPGGFDGAGGIIGSVPGWSR